MFQILKHKPKYFTYKRRKNAKSMTQSVRRLPSDGLFLLRFIKARICQISGYVPMSNVFTFPWAVVVETGAEKNLTV